MAESNKGGITGAVMFIFGAIFGSIASLWLATNQEGETKLALKKKAAEVKKAVNQGSKKLEQATKKIRVPKSVRGK